MRNEIVWRLPSENSNTAYFFIALKITQLNVANVVFNPRTNSAVSRWIDTFGPYSSERHCERDDISFIAHPAGVLEMASEWKWKGRVLLTSFWFRSYSVINCMFISFVPKNDAIRISYFFNVFHLFFFNVFRIAF